MLHAPLIEVLSRIDAAKTAQTQNVNLVAVSKTKPAEEITPLLNAGHRLFGENRVQEAVSKWPALKEAYPDATLHLIGPLQTNKIKEAVALFDVIETVDRLKLAEKLADEIAKTGKKLPCFVQVNTGAEDQKAGILPQEADTFIAQCRDLGLNIVGLMCIPPFDDEPSPHFALLCKIAERNQLEKLSMGMSADFETAIALGATHVRVGTALFGARG